jgi:hypothetical protein
MRRRELLVCSAVFTLPGCANTSGDSNMSKTKPRSHREESPTATAQPPKVLMPTAPNGWTIESEGYASVGDLGEVEGYETYYDSPSGEEYVVIIVRYPVEIGGENKAGKRWKELGWELFVAKGRYSFAVSWGEPGRPEPTPTPGHPPLPRGTLTEDGDKAGIKLLSHSPALTEQYIRENRYEALNPKTETDTTYT